MARIKRYWCKALCVERFGWIPVIENSEANFRKGSEVE